MLQCTLVARKIVMADNISVVQNLEPQNISEDGLINSLPFMSDSEWEANRTKGNFDYVIIGSSFCATGFTCQLLKNNPNANILIIEGGDYVHPQYFQDLPPPDLGKMAKETERFPWKIAHDGVYIKRVRGINSLFGGRSSLWKAWCPEPSDAEMTEWPDETIKKVHEYFPAAKKLLGVRPVNEIGKEENEGNKPFKKLQDMIFKKLESTPSDIEAITKVQHAPLAVVKKRCR